MWKIDGHFHMFTEPSLCNPKVKAIFLSGDDDISYQAKEAANMDVVPWILMLAEISLLQIQR